MMGHTCALHILFLFTRKAVTVKVPMPYICIIAKAIYISAIHGYVYRERAVLDIMEIGM